MPGQYLALLVGRVKAELECGVPGHRSDDYPTTHRQTSLAYEIPRRLLVLSQIVLQPRRLNRTQFFDTL
jgi:hypothetical protein